MQNFTAPNNSRGGRVMSKMRMRLRQRPALPVKIGTGHIKDLRRQRVRGDAHPRVGS